MLRCNFGNSLPHVSAVQKVLGKMKRINEGEFQFDELRDHLKKWNAVPFVHIHLDDTRIINKVDYDNVTGRFVGFCLPIHKGLPLCDSFIFTTFEEIKDAVESETKGKYAHAIVAEPITASAPSLIIFMLCTDSKYNHETIIHRWGHIEKELKKRGVGVISKGADGAGPFLKAMTSTTSLFSTASKSIPSEWTFFLMPKLREVGLCSQDVVHLLAKLRTRLLTPSNVIVMGPDRFACRGHLHQVLQNFSKTSHGLSLQVLENKDKQNYKSIETLLKEDVVNALNDLEDTQVIDTKATVTYLWLMRNIRDTFFDRGINSLQRLSLMWKTIFFMRIWRKWLFMNNHSASDHFVTQNVYICTELNAHMLFNLVYNVIKGKFPADALRIWKSGSQGCEQVFRLLRSMTPTFSVVVNFSMKGVLERVHKLNFLASVEASDEIVFPRAQRRLLQLKEETDETLEIPSLHEVIECIRASKDEAVARAKDIGMELPSYNDQDLLFLDNKSFLNTAFEADFEDDLTISDQAESDIRPNQEVVTIREDISRIFLEKQSTSGISTYIPVSNSTVSKRVFSLANRKDPSKSAFVKYKGVYIRKTTALYILQENPQLSNDRLLRVRSVQPTHLFSGSGATGSSSSGYKQFVYSGDLCIFQRIDSSKHLVGRVIQFSYLQGSKKAREYSSSFVDTSKESLHSIGVLANYYCGVSAASNDSHVSFKPLIGHYSTGYLSMSNYKYTIDDTSVSQCEGCSFSLSVNHLSAVDPNWNDFLSFEHDFDENACHP